MRHGNKLNKLSRTSAHRKAMMANMASSLIKHKRIVTTVAKAKALRVFVEPIITKSKDASQHNYRVAFSYLKDKVAVNELFKVVGEKVSTRNGGYTRILKTGNRFGDNADMAMIELVDFNEYFSGYGSNTADSKKTTRRSRRSGKTTEAKTDSKVVVEETAVVEDVVVKAETEVVSTEETVVADEVVATEETVVVDEVVNTEETVITDDASANVTGDDLTAINGIGPAFAERLNALGVYTFAELAALTDEKIAEYEEKDSMTSPEEWNNWIEQAKSMV